MKKSVLVIGGGPGGYPAAILAARAGFEVTLVEQHALGGTCLQVGCIPSKILLDAAKRLEHFKALRSVLTGPVPEYDYAKLIALSRERVAKITAGLEGLVRSNGVAILKGIATFAGYKSVLVNTGYGSLEALTADYIIIACGASAKVFPNIPYPHERVWTTQEALTSITPPEKILILGGGAIGCEFASFFGALSIPTTVIEALPRILPLEDADISTELTRAFKTRGIEIVTRRKAETIGARNTGVHITLDDGAKYEGSHLLVAVGIVPATDALELARAEIEVNERKFIKVETPTYQTNIPGVYAIGDAIAIPGRQHPGLAHVASAEAEAVVAAVTGITPNPPIDYDNVPVCTFTLPEVAHVGFTKEQAETAACQYPGHKIREAKVKYTALGRATALGVTEGFVKLVMHQDTFREKALRRIAGAHLVGEDAADIIHVIAEARNAEDSLDNFKNLIFQHPTWGELLAEAVRLCDDEAVHVRGERSRTTGGGGKK